MGKGVQVVNVYEDEHDAHTSMPSMCSRITLDSGRTSAYANFIFHFLLFSMFYFYSLLLLAFFVICMSLMALALDFYFISMLLKLKANATF